MSKCTYMPCRTCKNCKEKAYYHGDMLDFISIVCVLDKDTREGYAPYGADSQEIGESKCSHYSHTPWEW